MANEAYFIRQRSLLHLPSKPVAFLIQVSCLYFIYKVISIEAPKSNFQGIPLLPGLPVDKKRVRI